MLIFCDDPTGETLPLPYDQLLNLSLDPCWFKKGITFWSSKSSNSTVFHPKWCQMMYFTSAMTIENTQSSPMSYSTFTTKQSHHSLYSISRKYQFIYRKPKPHTELSLCITCSTEKSLSYPENVLSKLTMQKPGIFLKSVCETYVGDHFIHIFAYVCSLCDLLWNYKALGSWDRKG